SRLTLNGLRGASLVRCFLRGLGLRAPLLGEQLRRFRLFFALDRDRASLLCLHTAIFGKTLRARGANRENSACCCAYRENENDGSDSANERTITAREFAELIQRARCASNDRFVGQIPPNVRSQFRRRRIAPRLILLERLADDGLNVAAIHAADGA